MTFKFHQNKFISRQNAIQGRKEQIQTTFHQKHTDQQAYLHHKLQHPRSLKNNIPNSQTLRLKTICSATTEYEKKTIHK